MSNHARKEWTGRGRDANRPPFLRVLWSLGGNHFQPFPRPLSPFLKHGFLPRQGISTGLPSLSTLPHFAVNFRCIHVNAETKRSFCSFTDPWELATSPATRPPSHRPPTRPDLTSGHDVLRLNAYEQTLTPRHQRGYSGHYSL